MTEFLTHQDFETFYPEYRSGVCGVVALANAALLLGVYSNREQAVAGTGDLLFNKWNTWKSTGLQQFKDAGEVPAGFSGFFTPNGALSRGFHTENPWAGCNLVNQFFLNVGYPLQIFVAGESDLYDPRNDTIHTLAGKHAIGYALVESRKVRQGEIWPYAAYGHVITLSGYNEQRDELFFIDPNFGDMCSVLHAQDFYDPGSVGVSVFENKNADGTLETTYYHLDTEGITRPIIWIVKADNASSS